MLNVQHGVYPSAKLLDRSRSHCGHPRVSTGFPHGLTSADRSTLPHQPHLPRMHNLEKKNIAAAALREVLASLDAVSCSLAASYVQLASDSYRMPCGSKGHSQQPQCPKAAIVTR